ncbi:hypothetical protein SEA_CAFASSO_48 [Gordonia phage Cafasso]|uniref:Uncharacterized protein n=1 Tax=Gordonia phage Cafasso TaxID=2851095 RepID=A0AAE7SDS8_9CAUD|nr:hypothetical protein SEA_CAFASSO_48 [Gordonia phage Cafasso]
MTPPIRDTAKAVLRRAAGADNRFAERGVTSEMVDAWAAILDGKVWHDGAMDAVAAHYQASRFSIMPADVVDYCQRQPVWACRERAAIWLDSLTEAELHKISTYSGLPMPDPTFDVRDIRNYAANLVRHLRTWAIAEREAILDGILATRYEVNR